MDARSRRGTDTRKGANACLPSPDGRRHPTGCSNKVSSVQTTVFFAREWLTLALLLLLLFRAGTHPNPGPTLLQWNCNGISNKTTELQQFLQQYQIDVAAIQETKLTSKSKPPKFANYTVVRHDRDKDKGGGLMFLVHKDLLFQEIDLRTNDGTLELQAINITSGGKEMTIANYYIPPSSSCPRSYEVKWKTPPIRHCFGRC